MPKTCRPASPGCAPADDCRRRQNGLRISSRYSRIFRWRCPDPQQTMTRRGPRRCRLSVAPLDHQGPAGPAGCARMAHQRTNERFDALTIGANCVQLHRTARTMFFSCASLIGPPYGHGKHRKSNVWCGTVQALHDRPEGCICLWSFDFDRPKFYDVDRHERDQFPFRFSNSSARLAVMCKWQLYAAKRAAVPPSGS